MCSMLRSRERDHSVVTASDSVLIERSWVRIPAGAVREFSSYGQSTFCADSYFGIRSTHVLTKQDVKDPGHSAKSAGGRLQLNTHAPTYVALREVTWCKI